MIKLLNKLRTQKVETKSVNQIIDEIHDSFYTEVDRLLASAKIANSLSTDKQDLIDKSQRLKNLGFSNSKEVKDAESEIERLEKLKTENEAKKVLIEAINYFSFKYPNYKFITEESVKLICDKYNLVYGGISNYIGEVPDRNLKHIEDFKINEMDECYESLITYTGIRGNRTVHHFGYINKTKFDYYEKKHRATWADIGTFTNNKDAIKCELEIAAPVKDFNTKNILVSNGKLVQKIEIPDPVVLKPVIFQAKKYYLIVTAWGQEATDELVLNQNHN